MRWTVANKSTKTSQPKTVLTVQEVAAALHISRNRVAGFIRAGELLAEDWRTPGKSRHQWRIDAASVTAWRRKREFRAGQQREVAARPSRKASISLF
jgi:hypothetical protein